MSEATKPTGRTRVRQQPHRGCYDPEVIHSILDAGIVAHVGLAIESQPFVIPMIYGRSGDTLYLHGSAASRTLHELATSIAACVTVTLVDGLVLARSAFHHSMNYRSVVAFGGARKLQGVAQKAQALRTISEHALAGRWNDVRGPTRAELETTSVLEFSIEEASAKVRRGPPIDDEEDYGRSVWAGVLPLCLETKAPVPDPRMPADTAVPHYVDRWMAKPRQ